MTAERFREMQLLHALARNPRLTQRDLGKQIGAALGLTNLIVHRLCANGFIKIVEGQRHRNRYLMTSKGISEKNRLVSEYLEYSLRYYCGLRRFLRGHLIEWAEAGYEKILLFGPGEVAEVAYLTIQEVGLRLVGIVGDRKNQQTFLNLPVQDISEVPSIEFDRLIVATFGSRDQDVQALLNLGVPDTKLLQFPEDQALLPGREIRDWLIPADRLSKRGAVASAQTSASGDSRVVARSLAHPVSPAQHLPESTDVVILCGGRGTRLGSLTHATPKPLLPIGEEPFLLRLLLQFKQQGFNSKL